MLRLLLLCALVPLGPRLLRAQSAAPPDTLVADSFRYDAAHPNWQKWSAESTELTARELTPEGYHLRYAGSDPTGNTRVVKTFRLNDQQDYALETTLRLRGQGGLLWGSINSGPQSPPSDYQVLELVLTQAPPRAELWHYAGKWTKTFAQELPGLDAAAAHRLRVEKTGAELRLLVDGQPVGTPQPAAAWPGPDHDVGFFLENTGSEAWVSQLLLRHHSLIRLAPGVPRTLRRERLPEGINTPGEEIKAVVSADGRWLYFTRALGNPAVPNDSNTDIFVAERNATGRWGAPQPVGAPLNTPENDLVAYVAPDGQSLVVKGAYANGRRDEKALALTSRQPDGGWTTPVTLPGIVASLGGKYADRALDASGNVLLVAADKPGQEDTDLYVSLRQPDGSWGSLQPLAGLNTREDENSPFLAADGKTLYFASYGHPGYGRADIFLSRRLDDTWLRWSEPLNLGPGVNTPGYENHFSTAADGSFAYLTSREPGAPQHNTDLFRLVLPAPLQPAATRLVRGRILDARTGRLVPGAQVRYEQLPDGRQAGQVAAAAGTFEIALPTGQQYGFRAEAEGYVAASDNLDLSAAKTSGEVSRDLYLLPVVADVGRLEALQVAPPRPAASDTSTYASLRLKPTPKPAPAAVAADAPRLVLHNVFFEQGKPVLLPASYPELRRLAGTLRANPGLRIRLEGHTDNQGPADKNQLLSEQRVAEIKKYLIRQQVAAERLATIGYGPTRPVAPNDTEEHRRQNRRVEFVVLAQ